MKESNIFNNWLELDCFCMDIAEAWIKYRQSKNKEVSLDEFMEWCEKHPDGNPKIYFHNLKFDIQFVLYWLLKHDFKHIIKTSERATKTFQTLISDKGLYYCIEVIFFRKGKRVKRIV